MNYFICAVLLLIPTISQSITHLVTNINDSGSGSLRQAIIDLNLDATPPYAINFAIGTGVQTIQPITDLPFITKSNAVIDGTTQPGWAIDNPQIVINGSLLPMPGIATGIITLSATSNTIIQGLVINGANKSSQYGILISDNVPTGAHSNAIYGCFVGLDQTGTVAQPNRNGIRINAFTPTTSDNNIVGGTLPGQRNVISGNANGGLQLLKNVNNTIIKGNYIGTDKTGTIAIANGGFGIASFGSLTPLADESNIGTIIGGTSAAERNIIAGNTNSSTQSGIGIVLWYNTLNSQIINNYIGVDVTGNNSLPNDYGVYCFGTGPGTNGQVNNNQFINNVISNNLFMGMFLQNNIVNSIIQGNYIGTNASSASFGNGAAGIVIQGDTDLPCTNNLIGGTSASQANIITNNGYSVAPGYGVMIGGSATSPDILNPILGNSIYNNADSGIFLYNGGNNEQPIPTVNSAILFPGNTVTVIVTAPTTPVGAQFRIELFANMMNRTPITEGQRFIGSIQPVAAGASVTTTITVPAPALLTPLYISATATNLNNISNTPGDTSPFTPMFEASINNNVPANPIVSLLIEKYCLLLGPVGVTLGMLYPFPELPVTPE